MHTANTSANLWDVLCQDLEFHRSALSPDQHCLAAEKFKEAAMQVLSGSSARLCDAVEMAGDVCQAAGHFPEALVDFEDSLARNLGGGFTSSAARVATKAAFLLDGLGEVGRARDFYLQAIELYDAIHDHSQHGMLLSNLASLEKQAGNFPAAEKHYLRAIELATRLHGEIHPDVATACNNIAVAYTEAQEWNKAENMHIRALGVREQIHGAMHPNVGQSLSNLAITYHSSGNFVKAKSYYGAALKTYAAFQKLDAPESAAITANLAQLEKQIIQKQMSQKVSQNLAQNLAQTNSQKISLSLAQKISQKISLGFGQKK